MNTKTRNMTELQAQPPLLANTDFFDETNWTRLTEIMYEQTFSAGQMIFTEGEPADQLFYLKSGRAKVTKTTPDGKVFILHLYAKGDLFGQIDIAQDSVYTFSAEAIEDCEVGVIQQKDLEIVIWQYGELAIQFMKWMGTNQRMTETKFRDLLLFGKTGALCSTLIRLCNTYGEQIPEGILITKKMTHTDLADIIGATRESVNRMLQDLKRNNAVTTTNGLITVTDLEYLRGICQCDDCPAHICRI